MERVQDARIRRLPFQQKIGTGLTPAQFQKKVDDGTVRHVGLAESISMIADAMGWKLDGITDEIEPKIATETVESEFLAVDPGFVCGLVQDGVGYREGVPLITLHMEAYLGAPESYDAVEYGLAGFEDEDRRRHPRRHRDRIDRREFAAPDPGRRAGPSHDAGHAGAIVLRRPAGVRIGLFEAKEHVHGSHAARHAGSDSFASRSRRRTSGWSHACARPAMKRRSGCRPGAGPLRKSAGTSRRSRRGSRE